MRHRMPAVGGRAEKPRSLRAGLTPPDPAHSVSATRRAGDTAPSAPHVRCIGVSTCTCTYRSPTSTRLHALDALATQAEAAIRLRAGGIFIVTWPSSVVTSISPPSAAVGWLIVARVTRIIALAFKARSAARCGSAPADHRPAHHAGRHDHDRRHAPSGRRGCPPESSLPACGFLHLRAGHRDHRLESVRGLFERDVHPVADVRTFARSRSRLASSARRPPNRPSKRSSGLPSNWNPSEPPPGAWPPRDWRNISLKSKPPAPAPHRPRPPSTDRRRRDRSGRRPRACPCRTASRRLPWPP